MSAPGPASRAVLALTAWELRVALRRGENLLVTLVIPAAVLVFFSTVAVLPLDGPAVDWLLPGTLALGVIATSFVSLGIATAYERHYGVLKRLRGAPLPLGATVVAKTLAVLAIEIVQVVVLVSIAWLGLGWRPGAGASPGLGIVALVLGTATFAGLGLAMAGRLRAEATLAIANGVFLALLLVGGIVVPVEQLPGPLAAVAAILPAAPLRTAFDAALGGAAPAGSAESAMAILAVWAVASSVLGVVAFRPD